MLIAFTALISLFLINKADSYADESDMMNLTFYDSDKATVLASFDTKKDLRSGVYVYPASIFGAGSESGASLSDICKVKDGYALLGWDIYKRSAKSTDFSLYKTCVTTRSFVFYAGGSTGTGGTYNLAKNSYNCYAVYSDTPAQFPIKYVTNGGEIPSSAPKYVSVTTSAKLPSPSRKGCVFEGWYLDPKFSPASRITTISSRDCLSLGYADESCETLESFTVYAKWKSVTPQAVSISSLSNSSSGKVTIKLGTVKTAPKGYELTYATNSKFTSNVRTVEFEPGAKIQVSNLTKNKKYYFKIRAFNLDSKNLKVYSSYSSNKSITIKKGASEVSPTSSSAKIKSVKISGSSTKYLNVSATVSKRLKSYDDFYYLVKVDPIKGTYSTKIAAVEKSSTLSFKLPLTDSKGNNYYAGKFAIAVQKSKDKYMLVSSAKYIENSSSAAKLKTPYPTPISKKGRQGIYSNQDGDKNYFNNITINSIISSKTAGGEPFKYNGKTYYFKANNSALDNSISYVNKDGGTVTLQVMLKYDEKNKKLIKSSARSDHSKQYYAFNVEDASSRNQIEAAFYWLCQHYSQNNCRVDNWILGNEVNTYKNPIGWYWAGNISNEEFIKNYAQTFRILYSAAVSNNKNARVFTCVDHTFNNRGYEWGVKDFLVAFDKELHNINSKIKWNLAYHAYSSVLTNADFWNDNTSNIYSTSVSYSTDFISPLNIEVLVQYVREKFGKSVHIILSEQAFSSTAGTDGALNGGRAAGEDVQAAAVTYLFYKAMFNKDIDAVIYSHPYDNLGPGMDFSMKPKAYQAYKYMDTPAYGTYTTSCIGTISRTGKQKVSSWKNLVPSFDDSVLRKMPSR